MWYSKSATDSLTNVQDEMMDVIDQPLKARLHLDPTLKIVNSSDLHGSLLPGGDPKAEMNTLVLELAPLRILLGDSLPSRI